MVMNRDDAIREIAERYRQSGRAHNELQRRHWAAQEALKLGRGGITLVSKALRISPNTIKKGMHEIASGQADICLHSNARIRKPGGGRKSKKLPLPGLSPSRAEIDLADSAPKDCTSELGDEVRSEGSPPNGSVSLCRDDETAFLR